MARKDKQISKQLEAAGWSMITSNKHEKWICACGVHGPVIKPSTMGEGRGIKNFASIMKRQGDCSVKIKFG
jgi:hypothetical protein